MRIAVDANIMQDRPCIKGTRIPVKLILHLLAGGMSEEEIMADYPDLAREDIRACLAGDSCAALETHEALERKVRFLADENISPRSVRFLTGLGFDAVHVRDIGLKGKSGREIMAYAIREKRTLVTLDRDLADLINYPLDTHSGIIRLKLAVASPELVNRCLASMLLKVSRENLEGSLIMTDGNYLVF